MVPGSANEEVSSTQGSGLTSLDTLGSAFSLPLPCFLPSSASSWSRLVIAFCIVVSVSINKTSQRISLPKALYSDNIYRR